eukprot:TRINITY_DN91882_c0_g1_i1.p1 TRINITY_DN91882_c0_g1~~TRINITY_DN91882_c0_g1_i1.p1  ORF type:complete len:288 (+),score=79.67 TRINITY_DN91882_c0_g1_i1:53-916(+)
MVAQSDMRRAIAVLSATAATGGVVRSARTAFSSIAVTPQHGSRLPCTISPDAQSFATPALQGHMASSMPWAPAAAQVAAAAAGVAVLARGGRRCCASAASGASKRAAAVAVKAEGQSDVSLIDFRVGKIVSAEKHPDSEKLLIEQIEVGEEEPRQILSGIAKWFSPDDIVGRSCVVVYNLKEKKLGGYKSNGMLLCAKAGGDDPDGALEIVDAPEGAEVGERIVIEVEGEEHGEAALPNRVSKKKLYEKVAPELRTNADGTVCYKDSPFTTKAGPCTAKSIPEGVVS